MERYRSIEEIGYSGRNVAYFPEVIEGGFEEATPLEIAVKMYL